MKSIVMCIALAMFSAWVFAAVNINTATKEELDSMKGMGPVKAQAIIDYRNQNGPFKSIDDIKRVKGIGDKTFDVIKGDITLSGASVRPGGCPEGPPCPKAPPCPKGKPCPKKQME